MVDRRPTVQPVPVPRARSKRHADDVKVLVSVSSIRLRRGSETKYELSLSKPPLPHHCVIVSISFPNVPGISVVPAEVMFTGAHRKPLEINVHATDDVDLQRFKLEHRVKRTKHCDTRYTSCAVTTLTVQILRKDSLFVFTFGSNLHGRLGTATPTAACTPTPLRCKWLFPVQIACGREHSAIVDINSHLYCFGRGSEGQLGQAHVDNVRVPAIVASLVQHQVFHVACGANHTLCSVDGGRVFAWGDNTYGQLGVGFKGKQYHVPIHAKHLPCAASSIVCGGDQSFIISQFHHVYVAGCNLAGQLGLGDMVTRRHFTLNPHLQHTERLAAGTYHAIASTPTQVLVWGHTANGRLGLSKPRTDFITFPTPLEMFADVRVKEVAAGGMHTALLTQAGDLLLWGGNNYGQVGDGTTIDRPRPVRLRLFEGKCVRAIALGEWHSMALGDDGCVFAWGFGEEGQLGLGEDRNAHLPMVVHALSGTAPLRVHCGSVHSVVITSIEVANKMQQEKDRELSELHAQHEHRRLLSRKSMLWKGRRPTTKLLDTSSAPTSESTSFDVHAVPATIEETEEITPLSDDSLLQCLDDEMQHLTVATVQRPPQRPRRPHTARPIRTSTAPVPTSWRDRPMTSRLSLRLALREEFHVLGVMQRPVTPQMDKTMVYDRLHHREKLLMAPPRDPFDLRSPANGRPRRPSTAPPSRRDMTSSPASPVVLRVDSLTALLDEDLASTPRPDTSADTLSSPTNSSQ
ncbi:hypothetical protein SPRG_04908 [Saprolegnia parasitica CBS 223.65]|uniref:RCC1-like domain-containing protein n=1 Tax=Saprolegnia parasitica (strain CBS 223.65) TaxID=695850 RepID=A0A067CGC1_SAPPC|nr:hypothetical protein SPRG_04908 [Saprolegnia parasitica CBS 223.65]KDO29794.1 hypothetical protein SPRG_04908 [Saprolegnia parasitica CBS 223.65]|eukprot:XP_012199437.1 hypothetical protein SPRG_04908 [Saprolegnia parasitica CBS 223.65]